MVEVTSATTLEIEDELDAAFARSCIDQSDVFERIVLLDFREDYKADGACSSADWLAYRYGLSERTAREWVAIAKALDFLPAIACAYREGYLSYDKIRWLASFVTFAEDVEWASTAIGMSASEVRRIALERKRITREMADARFKRRYLQVRRDPEEGVVRIWGCLSDTEGEIVRAALERRVRSTHEGTLGQRRADALVEVCSLALGADADRDRATVIAHVDLETLIHADGNGMLEGGTPIAAETIRRLTCDARIQTVVHTPDGDVVAGRMQRTVSPSLGRQVRARDQHCVFPGCMNDVFVDAHHIQHHVDGGPTKLPNLVLLCGFHHRLVHEGGWQMREQAPSEWVFIRPDGTVLGRSWLQKGTAVARAP
jgi:hypothetical protein